MGGVPQDKATRDANLNELKEATLKYADEEATRIDNETTFLRRVLSQRGASDAGSKNLAAASEKLTQNEISDFLVFEA